MATLERNPFLSAIPHIGIDARVPAPFPIEALQRERDRTSSRTEPPASAQIEEPDAFDTIYPETRSSEDSVELPETVLDTVQSFNVS